MKACYIHVPFCNSICAYCDFVRCGYQVGLAQKWLHRMEMDLDKKKSHCFETVYIGGGTPTALNDEQFETLLKMLLPYAKYCKEYTIEANPDSLSDKKLKILKKYFINRISLGVQTFQKELQDVILRKHTINEIKTLINQIQENGIHNISIDLMYGLPTQTMDMWKDDLRIAVALNIQHISLYALTIEKNSQFGRNCIQGSSPQVEADMYEYAIDFLSKNGFEHYEISNFSHHGFESQHNQIYWNYDDFIGIGCGASGKEHHCRYENTRNLHTYIKEGASSEVINLSKEDEMFETIMMGLRMKKGISLSNFYQKYNIDVIDYYKEAVYKNVKCGYLIVDKNTMKTTYQGMLMLNTVLVEFL